MCKQFCCTEVKKADEKCLHTEMVTGLLWTDAGMRAKKKWCQ